MNASQDAFGQFSRSVTLGELHRVDSIYEQRDHGGVVPQTCKQNLQGVQLKHERCSSSLASTIRRCRTGDLCLIVTHTPLHDAQHGFARRRSNVS